MHVVDVLEMVEIEHQHRQRFFALQRLLEHVGAVFGQRAAIVKARKRIAQRERLCAFFGSLAFLDLARQVTIAAPPKQNQRNIEQ